MWFGMTSNMTIDVVRKSHLEIRNLEFGIWNAVGAMARIPNSKFLIPNSTVRLVRQPEPSASRRGRRVRELRRDRREAVGRP